MSTGHAPHTTRKLLQAAGLGDFPAWQLRLLGEDVWHAVELDAEEQDRRASCGLGAITDPSDLRTLCSLPWRETVPLADLPIRHRQRLATMPAGVIQLQGGRVTRLARPPAALRGALVSDTSWSRGLDRASAFAPFCPRVLLLTGRPTDLDDAMAEATFYGIGLAVAAAGGGYEFRVLPDPAAARSGPVSWRLREQAFAAITGLTRARAAHRRARQTTQGRDEDP
jgi:hypothetical protein